MYFNDALRWAEGCKDKLKIEGGAWDANSRVFDNAKELVKHRLLKQTIPGRTCLSHQLHLLNII